MKTPIRIIVAADFKGTLDSSRLLRAEAGKTDALIDLLKPRLVTKSGKEYQIQSMSDFGPEAVRSRLSSSVKTDTDVTAVLHDDSFRQVEASWRGLDFLVSKLPDEGVVLEIVDSSFDNLRRRILDLVVKPDYSGESEFPASIILADYDFSYKGPSFEIFKDLAAMAESLSAPFVAQTGPDFFNLKHLLHLPTIKNPLAQISSGAYTPYHEFRSSNAAFWASLMINRFLLRAPHSSDDYKEPADPSKPEQYLFGRSIWVLGANIIKSFSSKGHLVGISGLGTGGEQLNLPYRVLPLNRTEKIFTPLEASLPIDIIEGLPYLGLSPLSQIPTDMGGQNQPGMIYLHLAANMHHVPDVEEKQFGRLTVETSLAYSLTMGRISNLAFRLIKGVQGKTKEEIAVYLKDELSKDMWIKEQDEIKTEATENSIRITYRPYLVIHTRRFDVEVEVPL
jgi:predicted component of type VI protein secretion system